MASPLVWNSLLDNLRDLAVGKDSFNHTLKTFLWRSFFSDSVFFLFAICARVRV